MKRLVLFGILLVPLLVWAGVQLNELERDSGNVSGHCVKSTGAGENVWGDCVDITTFANLGTPDEPRLKLCTDCTTTNPCAGSGTGAVAAFLNGIWTCNGDSSTTTTTTISTTTTTL